MVKGAVVCLPVPAEGDVVRDSRVVWSPLALPTQPDAQYVSPKAELVLEAGRGQTPLYSFDEVLTTMPMMTAKRPLAEAKMMTISMLMKVEPFCAVTRAVLEPRTPTQMPQKTWERPTVIPIQKAAKPEFSAICQFSLFA